MITPESLLKSGLEEGEQSALFCWFAWNLEVCPSLEYAFAVPNGGERNPIVAAKLKAQGVKRGVPDIFIPSPQIAEDHVRWYAGLWIELKKVKGGKKNDLDQKRWAQYLVNQGYKHHLCLGFEDARRTVKSYFGESLPWRDTWEMKTTKSKN